ncbi:MAG: hypothetical protein M1331_01240, partial [Candidatus Marsarchaeota archaeon]|nr:hypothetical protein [Candidatus Marsarchaeota archaeon]
MEYLMTYGWAILIIAVVLAALDLLGVFNGSALISSSCLATPGYLCGQPIMSVNTTGPNFLSFSFQQDTGATMYNVSFACAASSSSQGYPNADAPNSGFVSLENISDLQSGSNVSVSGLYCYGSNAKLFQDHPIGSVFSGTLWIKYSLPGFGIQFAKVAKIIAKVELKNLQVYYAPPSPSVVKKVQLSYGAYPTGIAFYNDNGYVTNAGKNTVSVFNYTTAAIIGNITGFDYPTGIAFYNGNGYVINNVNDSVSIFNPATSNIVGNIKEHFDFYSAGYFNGVAFYKGNAYIANFGNGNVLILNMSTNTVITNITKFNNPSGIAFNNNYGYVLN